MGHQDPWSSRNPAPGPLSHLRAPILVTRPGVTELVTRHTVRSAREFAFNLPMALFFILLVLLLFACIFPLLASCCLIQNCSGTASLPHPAPASKTNPPFKQQQTQIQCDGDAEQQLLGWSEPAPLILQVTNHHQHHSRGTLQAGVAWPSSSQNPGSASSTWAGS